MGLKGGVTLIILALVLLVVSFLDICAMIFHPAQCTWYDILCHAGNLWGAAQYANCIVNWGFMTIFFRIGAAALFIAGIITAVKSGGKK
jgi:hypothetical protein